MIVNNQRYEYINKKNQKGTRRKFKLLETARRWARESPRNVTTRTDRSPGSDVVRGENAQLLAAVCFSKPSVLKLSEKSHDCCDSSSSLNTIRGTIIPSMLVILDLSTLSGTNIMN